jgi:phenylacetate-coenzyme A ligase PaaK-like adenylate-forming protein
MRPWGRLTHIKKDELKKLRDRKLTYFINTYVYPFSPHYRKVFDQNKIDPRSIRTAGDLSRIPFASKRDFLQTPQDTERFRDFILQPDTEKIRSHWPAHKLMKLAFLSAARGREFTEHRLKREFKPIFMTFTTGTTNRPVPFLYTNYDIENLYLSGARMLSLFDICDQENILNMFPYAPHLAFWQVVFGALSSNALALNTGGGKVMGTEGNIAAILKMKPAVILGVPSYVYHVVREAKERRVQFEFIRKVVLGASRVTPAFKIKLAEDLADVGAREVSIFGTYGFTEARCAWAECPCGSADSSGYHLYPDKEIFEVIDPRTGEVKGEGEDGELIYTALDARGSVVLRYRTGDFAKGGITYAPCPRCGYSGGRISSDITRLSDIKDLQLSKIKGSLVNLSNFDALFSEIRAVDEWQVEIKKRHGDKFDVDELIVYCSVKGEENKENLVEHIRKKVLMSTEISPNAVHVLGQDEMVKRLELETANKEKRIIDKRPKE